MAKPKKITKVKKKKKTWMPIYAPSLFNKKEIGETYLAEPEAMQDRSISINLQTLTNDVKHRNIKASFKITEVEGAKGKTELTSLKLVPTFTKRLVRRGREKIDDRIILKKGDTKIIIKPMIITIAKAPKSISTKLKREFTAELTRKLKKNSVEETFSEIINHRFQKDMKNVLNKSFPIKNVEIREISISS